MRDFGLNSKISAETVRCLFASWNGAVEAAGLEPITDFVPEPKKIRKQELMAEVIRLTKELGKRPSGKEMEASGNFSRRPSIKRLGSFTKAREAAYQKPGYPKLGEGVTRTVSKQAIVSPKPAIIPETTRPKEPRQRKKVQFGEPIELEL